MIILPRQARDKHRENSKKDRFLAGQVLTLIATKLDMWFTRQYKEERIDLLLSRISSVGADVVCLQEAIPMVWCSEYMERYVAAANAPIALSSIRFIGM